MDSIEGKRFGKLIAVCYSKTLPGRHDVWVFRCDCGKEKELRVCNVASGSTVSCGCYRRGKPISHGHNKSKTSGPSPEYRSWQAMWTRCTNKKRKDYARYGGRGVSVSERWRSFELFLDDMGVRPNGRTLDRINPHGNYEPGNCRWATAMEQRHNWRSKEGRE